MKESELEHVLRPCNREGLSKFSLHILKKNLIFTIADLFFEGLTENSTYQILMFWNQKGTC